MDWGKVGAEGAGAGGNVVGGWDGKGWEDWEGCEVWDV